MLQSTEHPSGGQASGKLCPGCGRDIGVWPVFSAGLPTRIWCPHCRIRLRYQDANGIFVGLLVALAVTALGAWWISGELGPLVWRTRVLWFCGLLLAVWVPVELVVVGMLRSRKTLTRVDA